MGVYQYLQAISTCYQYNRIGKFMAELGTVDFCKFIFVQEIQLQALFYQLLTECCPKLIFGQWAVG